VLTSRTQERQLQPRFRRVLTFGDVLDESIQLFRAQWLTFAVVSAVWLIPPGLLEVFVSASGALNTASLVADLQSGRLPSPAAVTALITTIMATIVVQAVFLLAWSAATVATADLYLHAQEVYLPGVLGRTLTRYLPVFLGAILYLLGLLILSVLAILPFVIPPIGLLGMCFALIGILVWWLRPTAQRTWLKWLIIVFTPFGLPAYFAGAWSMYLGAVVIEGHGPLGSLRRSMQLVNQQWFRVVGILTLGGLMVGVLQYAPSALIQIPLGVNAATRGQFGLGPIEQAISSGASVAVQILFASLASIIYTLLFIDLRNRREGTDLSERLRQLELVAQPTLTTNE
jgi:hypothetical protein